MQGKRELRDRVIAKVQAMREEAKAAGLDITELQRDLVRQIFRKEDAAARQTAEKLECLLFFEDSRGNLKYGEEQVLDQAASAEVVYSNALIYAFLRFDVSLIRYFVETKRVDVWKWIRLSDSDELPLEQHYFRTELETYVLEKVLDSKLDDLFAYLWEEELRELWSERHLLYMVRRSVKRNRGRQVLQLLDSKTTQSILEATSIYNIEELFLMVNGYLNMHRNLRDLNQDDVFVELEERLYKNRFAPLTLVHNIENFAALSRPRKQQLLENLSLSDVLELSFTYDFKFRKFLRELRKKGREQEDESERRLFQLLMMSELYGDEGRKLGDESDYVEGGVEKEPEIGTILTVDEIYLEERAASRQGFGTSTALSGKKSGYSRLGGELTPF